MPAQTNDDDDDDMLTDNNGLLSSFEIVSGDDDISADNVDTGDLLVEETPAADDMADLLVESLLRHLLPKPTPLLLPTISVTFLQTNLLCSCS
ncbi:MAG: hypothetical protein ACLTZI_08110 [[Eubacterium] siraeum]